MEKIEIEETKFSPHILLDKKDNVFFIKGRSIPNNASELYEPVINWLNEYKDQPNENTILEIHLEYFNTSTHKFLVEILNNIEQINEGKLIKWIYDEEDDDLLEIGERLEGYLNLDFEFIPVKD